MKLDYIEYILTIKINKLELVYTSKSYYEIENEIQHFLEKYSDYNLSFTIDVGWKEEKLSKEIKVSGDSLTEFWDNPEDDRWDREEEKQDER